MTIAESLIEDLEHVPKVNGLLVRQGLNPNDEFTESIGNSRPYQIAYAYGLIRILKKPNLSEGDWSRSWGDRNAIEKIVSSIFNKYAPDENPLTSQVVNISNRY